LTKKTTTKNYCIGESLWVLPSTTGGILCL